MSDQILKSLQLELVQGDDYLAADNRAVVVVGAGMRWPSAASAVRLVATEPQTACASQIGTAPAEIINVAGTYTGPTDQAAAKIAFDLGHAITQTLALGVRRYDFEIRATLASGSVLTLASGQITVT